MSTIFQAFLFALNLMNGMVNYSSGNYASTMLNTAIAGMCFGFLVSSIMDKS